MERLKEVGVKGAAVSRPARVLVVDDSDDDILLFHEAFERIDPSIECEVARDGREAIELLAELKRRQSLPQLVFMDLNMPILDGCAAVRKLRQELGLADLAVVVFTSSDLPEDSKIVYEAGANSCIRKPDNYWRWVDVIRSVLAFFIDKDSNDLST